MQIIEKQITDTIRTIESFFSECHYEVISEHETLNNAVVKTQRKDDGFFFEFAKMTLPSQDDRYKITYAQTLPTTFLNNFKSIVFDLIKAKCTFSFGFSGHTSVSGYIKDFTTDSLENYNESYYRAIIISESDHALSGFFAHNNSLKIGTTTYGSGVLEINIKGILLNLFSYTSKETKKSYFIVESQSLSSYLNFISLQDEIILAITYLTGIFLGKEIYIIGSGSKNFENTSLLSLKSFFDDLKNGYAILPDVNLQHQVNVPVIRFSPKYLENLIHELLNSVVYKRTLLLICQAHTEPAYVTSTLYSVALETITNIISDEIKEKLKPIKSKDIAQNLRCELKKTLVLFKNKLTDEAFNKITSDIERINSPTNKQKLLQPFKHFGINLPAKDIESIEKRNDFLHGRIPEQGDRHYLSITNGRLLFCINCLVLKHIGFEGYLVYFPSIYQINNKLVIEESLIREI
ncbi:hypothetical protein [Parasediminibacterium sp. JCM 36343]|uniref:hypothetical protein n=1 Tax=Parasediminibacterium sp. JCM 36343 TaxID=3374279 RepID=UPI00397D3652